MCTGVEIAAMAAMAAGSYMQYDSQQDAAKAQERAAMDEMARQSAIDKNKQRELEQALEGFDRDSQDANLEEATAERRDLFRDAARPEDGDGSFAAATGELASAPRVVQRHADRRQGEADDFVSLMGDARARLGAWGDAMWAPAQRLGDLSFDLNELNRQAGRSGQIGAYEAQYAGQNTGNEKALAGNLLSSAGSMGMQYGAANAPAGAANYQGPGFGGVSGNFAADYGQAGRGMTRRLGGHFYRPGGGGY